MTRADVAALVGEPTAAELERATLEVYRRGAELAASRGIIIADTKLEFGRLDDGTLMLADEVADAGFLPLLAWPRSGSRAARSARWTSSSSGTGPLASTGTARPPGPAIPPDIVAATQARYQELYTRLTLGRPSQAAGRPAAWRFGVTRTT